ncbi:beta-1 3-glucan biosynthesis protein [Pseudomonas viridiflava ICMP 13104]|uniref:Beta-1 3-glucan biosynthesis protein n=1 Tax=Pseudomonas viridiflava ICMP 13104 TaxID=1198305 RepID=A0A0W0HE88_PSEVI|nr:beta-1 3-glucan biosynthesis protein [Pseudomonas viridiflava ICMP 13104]
MKTVIERLEQWLENNLPEVRADLAPGCSQASLAEFESQVGRAFPQGLADLYRAHDGQAGGVNTGPFFGLTFLSLAQARNHWESWKQIVDEYSPEDMKEASAFCKSAMPGGIKEVYANQYWVPFAHDYGGNYLGVDLDPAQRGTSGQVINFGRDEDERFVVALSLETFVEWLVCQLESGNALIRDEDDGGRSLNIREPESYNFLDSLPVLFASQRDLSSDPA